jgi:hypothetical protein
LFVLGSLPALGQSVPSKEPSSTHIFPAGGRRGTVVPVRVGAECLPPGAKLHVWGGGVKGSPTLEQRAVARYTPAPRRPPEDANPITYPKEWQGKIEIDPNASLGTRSWRVTCGWGGTRVRPFLVGDLPEFIEVEPNSDPAHANRVTLPVTVNGQIAGERDVDCFVFAAEAGAVVVCDVLANRIGSPLDPVVEIRDGRGRRVEVQEVRIGNDPVIAFRAGHKGDYVLQIAHVGLQGGPHFVYRINISTASFVHFAFPPNGVAGETRDVQLFTLAGTGGYRVIKEKVTFPKVTGPFEFRSAVAGINPVSLICGDGPELVEPDSHTAGAMTELKVPAAVNGRFANRSAESCFRFTAKKDSAYTIVCEPFPPRISAAVPVVVLQDASGRRLAYANGVDSSSHRCRLEWKAPADGVYRLCLRDLQFGSGGGPDFLYRLAIRPAQPDFELRLASDYLNVTQGGRAEIDLLVRRTGGFTGPIDVSAAGLPSGVRLEPVRVAENQVRMKLSVVVQDETRPADTNVRLTGTAVIGGKQCWRIASAGDVGDASTVLPRSDTLHLTVQHKPLFRLYCNEAYQYGHRGTIYPYRMQIERLNGFKGKIVVQICDRQVQDLDGIEIVETVVSTEANEFDNLVYLPETMHVGVQHHCRPYAQGYALFVDRWGQQQSIMAISEKRCMIRTLPPVVKLRAKDESIVAKPGAVMSCKLELERTSNFTGPMELVLVGSGPESGFTADPVHVAANQTAAVVKVHVGKAVKPREVVLQFRALGKLAGATTVVTETSLSVKLTSP